jgi:predicted amidohydrolase
MNERSLVVAALQTGLYPKDAKRAVREALSLVKSAAEKKGSARLVCFPEHWLTETIMDFGSDEIYGPFSDLARDHSIYLNLGGIYEKDQEGKTFFLSPTISPRGEIISKQKKVHLFRRENEIALPGDRFEPFEIDDIKIGVMVCHDVVFPESARTLVLKGAEMLLNPSLIPTRGIEPWKIYIMARALENRVPIVAPNPYLAKRVPGDSVIIGLKYEKAQGIMQVKELAEGGRGKKIIRSKLVFNDDIAAQRTERLNERKPLAYYNG